MFQVADHVYEPVAVPARLQSHTHLPGKPTIKTLGFSVGMHQLPFSGLSCFAIYKGDLLPTGMEITTYNDHLKAPSSQLFLSSTKNTWSRGAFALIQSILF
jgi:hypothetical protein